MKISTRIVKYESRVVKSNPDMLYICNAAALKKDKTFKKCFLRLYSGKNRVRMGQNSFSVFFFWKYKKANFISFQEHFILSKVHKF